MIIMLEKIQIRNFKSIKDQTISFKNINIIIGANNSGKSNLLDCLLFVPNIFRNPLDSLFGPGPFSYPATLFKGADIKTDPISLHVTYRNNKSLLDYEIEIKDKSRDGVFHPYVLREQLKKDKQIILSESNIQNSFIYDSKKKNQSDVNRSQGIDRSFDNDKYLINTIKVRKYQFIPKIIKKQSPVGSYDYGFIPFLDYTGENLLDVLYHIRENDVKSFTKIIEDCQKFFPNLKNINIQRADETNFSLQVTLEIGKKDWRFIGPQLSDGFAIILAIVTLLNSKSLPDLVLIEEIENGLNPSSIEKVLNKIFEISQKNGTQFFITTHSPMLIQLLKNNPEYVIVCEQVDGISKFTPLQEKLAFYKEDFQKGESLIELWFSGLIGGL